MNIFKIKKLKEAFKRNPEMDSVLQPEEMKSAGNGHNLIKSVNDNAFPNSCVNSVEEDEDDDFITNEVKRRLKELRRNTFMVLIPEEKCLEDEEEEEGETSSGEWSNGLANGHQFWSGFDAVYDKYCKRMLFFDRISSQQLKESGLQVPSSPSPRSASRKLVASLRSLSLKKIEKPEDETEHLQQPLLNPYHDLETAYVAQLCLSWEALHCQYTQLSQKISCQPEDPTCYIYNAQQFQQFLVLLQRFIENEPFEQGLRPDIYARARQLLPKLLQVPSIQGLDNSDAIKDSEVVVHASDLIQLIESSILTFRLFAKLDQKKPSGLLNLFGGHNQMATPLQQVESALEKKNTRLKELCKKKRMKKRCWPARHGEVELMFGLIDIKVVSRVLRMARITKEQLLWCEDKMKKLDLTDGKLRRDPSPTLFPC